MQIVNLQKHIMKGKEPAFAPVPDTWIAGGAIRKWYNGDRTLSDIDVFAKNEQALDTFRQTYLSQLRPAYSNPITDSYNFNGQIIQLIKNYKESIESLFGDFDFHLCQFGWDGSIIYTTVEAIISVERKHLTVQKILPGYELDSLRRAFKYQRQGFEPCLGTIRDLSLAIFNIQKKVDLQNQIQLSPNGGSRFVPYD